MTIEINRNKEFNKSEGISVSTGLTGELGSGGDFKPPFGMPGVYKYKLQRKQQVIKEDDLNTTKT